jgi:lyso-ornithine lipid O-acyltransferase
VARIRFYCRCLLILAAIIVLVPIHYLWRLFGARSPWPTLFLWWVGRVAGLDVTVEGKPLKRDVLIVANHASWLDILLLGGTAGAAFVAKAELADSPVVGWLAGLNDTLFVERSDKRGVGNQVDALREGLATGRAFALFPEGTTGPGRPVLPFRASLFASLFPPLPRVRIQPVAIDFGPLTGEVAWGDEHGAVNARRLLSRPGRIPVVMRFLEPVDPHHVGNRKLLSAQAREEIVAALDASEAAPAPLYGGE